MDEASEEVAVELAAQGVIGKRVDEMEPGFMMALDYMIQLAEKDQDDKVNFRIIPELTGVDLDDSLRISGGLSRYHLNKSCVSSFKCDEIITVSFMDG